MRKGEAIRRIVLCGGICACGLCAAQEMVRAGAGMLVSGAIYDLPQTDDVWKAHSIDVLLGVMRKAAVSLR